jgi:hypothetical protein
MLSNFAIDEILKLTFVNWPAVNGFGIIFKFQFMTQSCYSTYRYLTKVASVLIAQTTAIFHWTICQTTT